jgi:hypothetical protein
MARIDTVRTNAATPRAMNDMGPPPGSSLGSPLGAPPAGTASAAPPATAPSLEAFRAGRSETERTADLLAFAIAADRGLAQTPDAIERARQEADAALGDYSLRYLHNHVEQIRQEAIAEHLGRLRPPPGFARLVIANLVALVLAGALAAWAWTRPEVRDALARVLGG